MKKKWIAPVIVLVFLLLLAGVYATRNEWTAYALRRMVNSRSAGQITLDFTTTEVDVFTRTLAVYAPKLTFKDVYFNKAAGTKLEVTSFQKLIFKNIALWDLLKHKQFICDNLSIEKPMFILGHSHAGVKAKAKSFDPETLITVLLKHEITHLDFQFLIHHSTINFGEIDLSKTKGKDIYGSTRYNISIENMGTIKATGDSLHPLSFKSLELSIRNLHRYSAAEHLDIRLDSAFYSSRNSSLFLNGLQVASLDKKTAKIPVTKLYLRWAKISGLESKKQKKTGKKTLQLNNIKVVGGSYTFKSSYRKQEKKVTSDLVKKLFASYNILSLDSLSLNHIHLFEVNDKQDTLLKIRRVNVQAKRLWTSKHILTDPLKSLHYQNLALYYQEITYGDNKSPVFVESGKSQYNSRANKLSISDLKLRKTCKADSAISILFKAKKLSVGNLSDQMFLQNKHQVLSISVDSPDLYWNKDSLCHQKPVLLPAILQSFQLGEINIRNGNLNFEKNKNINLNVHGIHLFANGLSGTIPNGSKAALKYDSIFYHSKKLHLSIASTGQSLKTEEILWNKPFFKISKLYFTQTNTTKHDTLNIQSVTFTHLKLNSLLFHQRITASGAYLYKANFSQDLENDTILADTLRIRHWNSFVTLPFKTDIAYVRIRKSQFSLSSRSPGKNFHISSQLGMKLFSLKMGYDSSHLFSQPKHWEASLKETKISKNGLTVGVEKTTLNGDAGTLQIQNVSMLQMHDSSLQIKINIPRVDLLSMNYDALLHSDSLIFGKATIQQGNAWLKLINYNHPEAAKAIRHWTFLYDSIVLSHTHLQIDIQKNNALKTIRVSNLNLFYHPNLLHWDSTKLAPVNLMKYWDFNMKEIVYSDTLRKIHVVADRIALQSDNNTLSTKMIIGTNFSASLIHPAIKNIYTYFLINNLAMNNISLSNGKNKSLHIKSWFIPGIWINIIDNDTIKKKRSLSFLHSNFFSQYTGIIKGIHVDSSFFKNVNFSYQYDNMKKLVNVKNTDITTSNIQLGDNPFGQSSDALFGDMLINLNGRAIISGDSMYTFRTRDIRVSLADRKISLDSITITPRFSRKDFFAKAGFQTDRITLYGKSAILDGFNPDDLLNNHFIHFENLQLNSLSLRFERDMHYPRRTNIVKPLPIDMLAGIPYQFKIDSVQLVKSMISYFEYEVKSKNPGIFFIDNFNVLAENVTNDFPHIDSNMVLKFHGSGKLMKQANLDFTLVMPYFAPHRQWWFSAEAGQIDLTQFNLLTENVLGLTIRSGIGSLQVPLITGNDSAARGSVNFLYHKLRLRLYNREKSEKSKKFYSPFANFVMNSLVINSNNPPFLGHPKKGIVYFERVPEKSFVNYLWKSNLSGILSTLGFNNKQQREGKREDKKQIKSAEKSKGTPSGKK